MSFTLQFNIPLDSTKPIGYNSKVPFFGLWIVFSFEEHYPYSFVEAIMKIKNHPDYEHEVSRLEETKVHIEHTIKAVDDYRRLYSDNIKDAMSDLDTQESSSNYINVLINTQFVEIANKNYDNLIRAQKKPYFARIDFIQKGTDKREQFYIGKTSLLREGEFTPLVVDWRAPIANLYYEGRLGENTYESEGDTYVGELMLKRQIAIENAQLVDFIDVDITTNDAFLQASLEASADQRLKDIASTIQAEQNRVIRANMRRPLIVQGVAGSGKTTIALHRIAYFIYTYEKTFNPETFMIIAPNRLFINYISEVLPELGVEKVKQTTFIDFMTELIGKKLTLVDKNQKLLDLIHAPKQVENIASNDENPIDLMIWSTRFKGSLKYKEGIEAYLAKIEKFYTPSQHFTFQGEVLATRGEIRSLFLESYQYMPLTKRVHEIKKLLTHRLKTVYKDGLSRVEMRYNDKIDLILRKEAPGDMRRQRVVELMDERDAKIEAIKVENKHAVKSYMALFPNYDFLNVYYDLMTQVEQMTTYFGDLLTEKQINYHIELSKTLRSKGKFELEDLSALLYVKHRLHGFDDSIEITTLVIDEAQDFSTFQFFILKHVLKTARLTLLGDLSQGIHAYRGTTSWDEVMQEVFPNDLPSYMTLVQSYRTTVEIMDLANTVLAHLNDPSIVYAKPVIRHGTAPTLNAYEDHDTLIQDVEKKVDALQAKGYKSIALLCKTRSECDKVKRVFDKHKKHSVKILDEKEENYSAGVILVPSYFAKGLEFDAVVIITLTESYTKHPLDVKLLYVAMTRSLHHLDVFYMKDTMPLFQQTN